MSKAAFIFKGESDEAFTVIVNSHTPAPVAAEMIKAALPFAQPFTNFSAAAFAAAFIAGNLNRQTTPAEIPVSQPKAPKAPSTKGKGKKGAKAAEAAEAAETPAQTPAPAGDTPLVILASNYRDYTDTNFVYKLNVEKGQALITMNRVKCTDPDNPKSVNSWDRKKNWSGSLESFYTEINEEVLHPLAAGWVRSGAPA